MGVFLLFFQPNNGAFYFRAIVFLFVLAFASARKIKETPPPHVRHLFLFSAFILFLFLLLPKIKIKAVTNGKYFINLGGPIIVCFFYSCCCFFWPAVWKRKYFYGRGIFLYLFLLRRQLFFLFLCRLFCFYFQSPFYIFIPAPAIKEIRQLFWAVFIFYFLFHIAAQNKSQKQNPQKWRREWAAIK